jgi:hypothetical protein
MFDLMRQVDTNKNGIIEEQEFVNRFMVWMRQSDFLDIMLIVCCRDNMSGLK